MSDTLNFGAFVVDIRNRPGADKEEGDARTGAADRAVCLNESGAMKPIAPCTAANAQQANATALLMMLYTRVQPS